MQRIVAVMPTNESRNYIINYDDIWHTFDIYYDGMAPVLTILYSGIHMVYYGTVEYIFLIIRGRVYGTYHGVWYVRTIPFYGTSRFPIPSSLHQYYGVWSVRYHTIPYYHK